MKEQFVPYELALKLKELGFYEECLAFYIWQSWNNDSKLEIGNNSEYTCETINAPLWQQAFDWFREKYNLSGEPQSNQFAFSFNIIRDTLGENKCLSCKNNFEIYEEARQACLEELTEIVENQK